MSDTGDDNDNCFNSSSQRNSNHSVARQLYNNDGYKIEAPSSGDDSNDSTSDEQSRRSDRLGRTTFQIVSRDGVVGGDGPRSLDLRNISGAVRNISSGGGGATILQYGPGSDGQLFIPMNSSGMVFPQSLLIGGGGGGEREGGGRGCSPGGGGSTDDSYKRRELRLLKNKEAAKECRRKKKEYIRCLENRVAVLETQNKTLIEELKSLKELYCQKDTTTADQHKS